MALERFGRRRKRGRRKGDCYETLWHIVGHRRVCAALVRVARLRHIAGIAAAAGTTAAGIAGILLITAIGVGTLMAMAMDLD